MTPGTDGEQHADVFNHETQFARPPDEGQSSSVFLAVAPMAGCCAGGLGHETDALVLAVVSRLTNGDPGEVAYQQPQP